ncbi:uncharacterized protein JN550_009568 [Neoarthrinium moseri]|uniref:uncharacterized protein n=1 Tax=Neoarthrinium moseri TaxID=1658444 RepID=UPI001FDBCF89|nr:uncharacterized protein JN550_009568 [Neoarthrinium moseri]KAI1863457.1 hypothetical protein JN550_009568 [Neoarthrinium moseri]
MEASTAKRRKLSHGGGGPAFLAGASSGSASSALIEATQELVNDVQVDYGQAFEGVDQTLRQFKETIEALEPHDPELITKITASFQKNEKITVPYPSPRPAKDSPYKLSFAKPSQVNVVGSYQLRTMVRSQPDMSVDMIVVMPASIFQDKDYRDGRYFLKRSYYCAYIAAGIRKSAPSFDIAFDHLEGNQLLPVAVVRPKGTKSDKKGYAIRIIPCAPDGLFPTAKLGLTSSNTKDSTKPTPFYNSTLRAESLFVPYLRLLNNAAKSCPAFREACMLGRIWLQQRGFGSSLSEGGFGHFEWAVLVALLLQGGGRKGEAVLSSALNSSQLFKATMQYLALTNLQKKPVVFGSQSAPDSLRQNGPVVWDAAREHNLFFKMTSWAVNFLQQQAKWSLAGLKSDSLDQFDSLFVVKVDQMLQTFDLVVKIRSTAQCDDSGGDTSRGVAWDFAERLHRVLKRALGDRAQLVHAVLPKHTAWSVTANPPGKKGGDILIGVVTDPSLVARKMDLGPSVEQKEEAAKYRDFWGEKAELRRFQDGSILESIEWNLDSERSIPEQIIRYAAKKHFTLQGDDLSFFGANSFSKVAHLSYSDAQYFSAARQGFESLEKEIREVEDLPLHVRQVAPVAPELRYASLHPPSPASRLPMDIALSFEASGKWTDNVAANQRLKMAFLLKLGASLGETNPEIKTHIGLEQVNHDSRNIAFLDVSYEDGFVYRIRLQSDVDEKILETQLRNKQLDRQALQDAAESLAICKRLYTNLPLHSQTLSTWCTRYPPLSDSIRMLKYWFSCHRLASHFNEELIELFALRAFITPSPWQVPTSAMTGFLRAIHLIARWDWIDEPLVIDHSESITAADRSAVSAQFHELRRQDPRMNRVVLFVATSHDTTGTAHTRNGPSRVVANQMTKLARSTCEAVKNKGVDLDPRSLFQSSLKHYDVVIRLNSKVLKAMMRDDGSKHSQFKNLDKLHGESGPLPLIELPAKTLAKQLNAIYSNAIVFFRGAGDDNIIAGLWNPEIGTRTRKVDMPCAYKPDGEGESLQVDREAILSEIARVGGDVIEKIEVKGTQ